MSILDVILILLVVILVVATIFSFWFFYKRLQSHKTDSSLTTDQQQINESIKAIETQLKTIQSNNLTVNSNTDKNFGAIKTTLDSLGNRSEEINKIFLNIKSRGNFGEFQLETLLTDAFGNNSSMVEFQYRIPNSDGIVDAIIKINQQFFLGIDAKFPLENYRHVVNAKNETDRDEYQKKFKRDILNKIKEVQKYISPENHINNIILFIPSENVYSSIIEWYGNELINQGYKTKVYFTSPTTLAALIDIIIKNDDRSKTISNINEILSNLDKVYQLFVKWSKEWNTFVQQLNTVVKSAKNLTHRQRLILSKIEKLNKGENATFNNEDLIDETKMRENELTETSQSLRNKNDDVNSDN